MAETDEKSTIDKKEIEFFKSASEIWWNETGVMKPLHTMNEFRVPMVKEGLERAGLLKQEFKDTETPLKGIKILDVGCGGGLFAEPLAKLGAEVTGIDPIEELINVAKYHASLDESLTNLNYIQSTVEEYAEQNAEKYDCIVNSEVLEHINNVETMVEGCTKCTKPGGYLYFSTYNKTLTAKLWGIWGAEYVFQKVPKGAHEYEKFITPEDVTKLLEKYNCKTTGVEGFYFSLFTCKWYRSSPSVHYGLHAIKNK